MITLCARCDNLHPDSKGKPPWRWMCSKHPRMEGYGFVTETQWDNFDPWLYCRDVNGGCCPLHEPKREDQ
jgi:hypothetical protein